MIKARRLKPQSRRKPQPWLHRKHMKSDMWTGMKSRNSLKHGIIHIPSTVWARLIVSVYTIRMFSLEAWFTVGWQWKGSRWNIRIRRFVMPWKLASSLKPMLTWQLLNCVGLPALMILHATPNHISSAGHWNGWNITRPSAPWFHMRTRIMVIRESFIKPRISSFSVKPQSAG